MRKIEIFAILLLYATTLSARDYHCCWKVPKKGSIENTVVLGDTASVKALENGWLFSVPVKGIPAGEYVEFDFTIRCSANQPEYYAVDYFDQGKWKTDRIVKSTLSAETTKEATSVLRTIRLADAIGDGSLQLRIRAVSEGEGRPKFLNTSYQAAYIATLGTKTPIDTSRVLCIGNSFTHVGATPNMLKEIAWSQGHFLDVEAVMKGGQTFGQHLALPETTEKIREGRYDYVFMQNQSQANARYCSDAGEYAGIMEDAKTLSAKVRRWSPAAKLIFESTWSYPGRKNGGFASMEEFDRLMQKGTDKIAKANKGMVSPIGRAFAVCRAERPDIKLCSKDNVHQSMYGAYLKACVNYLVIFREPFVGDVPATRLDPQKAEYLRQVAMRTVLGK